MPYHVYKVRGRHLEALEVFAAYRDARVAVRALRGDGLPQGTVVRMVYATTPAEAERLLLEVREARPMGEEA